jgi:hypothetical protein
VNAVTITVLLPVGVPELVDVLLLLPLLLQASSHRIDNVKINANGAWNGNNSW